MTPPPHVNIKISFLEEGSGRSLGALEGPVETRDQLQIKNFFEEELKKRSKKILF